MQNSFLLATTLSDEDLLRRMEHLAAEARHATADLIAHLAEVARRQAYLPLGYGSLFAYCTAALRLSEHAAYNRIEAARAARRFPIILDRLAEGAVNLTTVRLLAPHLTAENHERLLSEASRLRKSAVEELLARLAPKPDVPTSIRALPRRAEPPIALDRDALPAASAAACLKESNGAVAEVSATPAETVAAETGVTPSPRGAGTSTEVPPPSPPRGPTPMRSEDRAIVEALAPERYLLKVTLPATTRDKLRLLQELFCREVPDGDAAVLIDMAFDALIVQGRRTKQAATVSPRAARPSAPVFCRPHNGHEARRFFGAIREHMPAEAERMIRAERTTRSGTSGTSRDGTTARP